MHELAEPMTAKCPIQVPDPNVQIQVCRSLTYSKTVINWRTMLHNLLFRPHHPIPVAYARDDGPAEAGRESTMEHC
jgi:hypothetical protein